MNTSRSLLASALLLVVAVAAVGCDAKKAVLPGAKSPTSAAVGESNVPTLTSAALPGMDAAVETNGLHVSDAIARACALPKPTAHTSFDFDSTAIGEDDRVVLAAVAKCLTEGALRDRNVSLIGRADPRGEDEYNMSLGGTRSESVRRYLHDLGVRREHLSTTSRGELDATGKDESGFARDRRVDIELAN